MFERFTDGARRAVVMAQEEARRLKHTSIGTEHILLGLIAETGTPGTRALEAAGIDRDALRWQVERAVPPGTVTPTGHIPFTPRAKKVLELSLRESLQLGHNYIGTEHLLLGLMREGEATGAQALRSLGADTEGLRRCVRAGGSSSAPASAATSGYQFERYTDRARRAVVSAQEDARGLRHTSIDTEHLLLGLFAAGGVAAQVLESLAVSREVVHARVVEIVGPGTQAPTGHIPFTPRAKKVLELSLREALTLGHDHVGPEHLLLGLVRAGEGVAVQILTAVLGEDGGRTLRDRVVQLLSAPPPEAERPEPTALRDLTQAARRSQLDPVAGREREIQRVMQVLMRKSRNSALLVGEPGVGRTAIVMGLAQRLASGAAPAGLSGVRLCAVDPQRVGTALERLREPASTVLFLDDAELGEGSETLSALRESGARVIAVVEPAAQRPALETFFQPVPVDEPSVADMMAILRLLRPEYERHHGVSITDDALEAAIALAIQHRPGQVLPGKAIEVMDEAGARVRLTDGARTVDGAVVAGLFAEGPGAGRAFDDDRYVWAMS